MATVNVLTPKNSTAPMSFSVSISASATPAASAGRASGSATCQNVSAARAPERAAHLQHAYRLRDEARPRGDVDVRIEHRAHHQDRAAEAADVGEPVASRVAPAEQIAQGGLHHPGIVEQLKIGIGDDIGRDRQRQQQQPLEIAPPREAIHGDEPRACRCRSGGSRLRRPPLAGACGASAPGSTFAMRCGQVLPLGLSAMRAMARIGRSAISEMTKRRHRPAEIAALIEAREPPAQRLALGRGAASHRLLR